MKNNVYAPPKSQIVDDSKSFELCVDGRYVVTKPDAHWGDCCYRCNEKSTETIEVKLTCQPKRLVVAFVVLLFGGFVLSQVGFLNATMIEKLEPLWFFTCFFLLLLSVLLSKRIKLTLPICNRHRRLKRQVSLGAIVIIALYAVLVFLYHWLLIFVIPVLLVCAFFSILLDPRLVISKKQDGLFWVKGTSEAFRDKLPEFR